MVIHDQTKRTAAGGVLTIKPPAGPAPPPPRCTCGTRPRARLARRQASAAQGKTLSENARIFALLAMAICDGSIACFDTKFHYNFWRPVTAIRAGDTDGNDLTDPIRTGYR